MAAYEEAQIRITLPAGADLSAQQYRFVAINSSGQIVVAGEGGLTVGVLQNAPGAAGQAAEVAILGVSKIIGGGAVTAGLRVSSDLNGAAIAVGSGDDSAMGIAIETIASGTIYPILLQPVGRGL